ncbi:unnamed protein product [Pylaiella littoralis]
MVGYKGGAGATQGTFADPETNSVESSSSRGPCIVDKKTRFKPTTCAADRLSVSARTSGRFSPFSGTSAAAPVAAAIATIVKAACYPKAVMYDEMMEMLTNYDYTIDYISDGDFYAERWGAEAGYGIISARKMLAWVEANCHEACPEGRCGNGLAGIQTTNLDGITACCPRGCKQCGGAGCDVSGLVEGYYSGSCCIQGGVELLKHCNATGAAPCVVNDQVCSNGMPGFEGELDGITVCCSLGCGQCGGANCDIQAFPNYGEEKCCIDTIIDSGNMCYSPGATAPCIISLYPECTGHHPWIGDGTCDDEPDSLGDLNRVECDYDGGDCCKCTCEEHSAANCVARQRCLDPTSSCYEL